MPRGRPDKGYALTPQRERVLKILAEAGGSLDDEAGLVVSKLKERTGHESTQALSMVIKQLEESGLVKRDVAGRRTYHLELVESAVAPEDRARIGLRNGHHPARAIETPQPLVDEVEDSPGPPSDGTDYRRLADEMLKRAAEILAGKADSPKLQMRLVDLEGRVAEYKERIDDLEVRLLERGEEILRLKEQLRIAEHNLAVIQKQKDRQKAERGSDPIEKRLTERERKELDDLKRVMESRPGTR